MRSFRIFFFLDDQPFFHLCPRQIHHRNGTGSDFFESIPDYFKSFILKSRNTINCEGIRDSPSQRFLKRERLEDK
jgi:hypothetical protein